MYNIYLILLFIVPLYQANSATTTEATLQLYTGTSTNIILNTLENLDKLITNLSTSAKNQFEKQLKALELQCQSYINETLAHMDIVIDPVLSQINNIPNGTSIRDCANKQENRIKTTYLQLSNEMVQCFTSKIREAYIITQEAVDHLQKYPKELLKLREDFEKCNGSIWCNSQLLFTATINSADIALAIPALIAKTLKLMVTTGVGVPICKADKVALMTTETGNALFEIGICASETITDKP